MILCMSANASASDWSRLEPLTVPFRDTVQSRAPFRPVANRWRSHSSPHGAVRAGRFRRRAADPLTANSWTLAGPPQPRLEIPRRRMRSSEPFPRCTQGQFVRLSPTVRSRSPAALDNTVRVWDVETGRALRVLEGHSAGINSVAWSPDGGRALSGAADQTVRVWDVETGRALRVLEGHSDSVRSVAWSRTAAARLRAEDKTVRVWDVETGRALRALEGHPPAYLAWRGARTAAARSPAAGTYGAGVGRGDGPRAARAGRPLRRHK